MKIKTKLILLVTISMILSTVLFTYNMINSYKEQLKKDLKDLTQEAYQTKKEELLNYSDMASKVIDSYYQKTKQDKIEKNAEHYVHKRSNNLFNIIDGYYKTYHTKMSDNQLKKHILEIIKNAKDDKNSYFWINDMQPKMIMHPFKPALNGKDLSNFKDPNGVYLFNEMVKIVSKTGEGVVKYHWSKPGHQKPVAKISFVRVFKPFNWIIGTGIYVDDLTTQMQKEALNAIKNMRYGKNGYFWINNMENKMLMHPIKPQYNNKLFINTPKVPFVELGTKKLKEIQKDKAFIEYSFYTPATKKYSHKLSIVEKFKPWGWVIGTGTYTDYLDVKIQAEKKEAQEDMKASIIYILVSSLVILIILILLMMKFMENIIINPLNNFQKGLNKFFKYLDDESIKIEKFTNNNKDEIGIMSQNTNIAIESAVKTHKELMDLRKQLEEKVETTTQNLDKTHQELDIVNQTRKESLQYGAMIQTSILPDIKTINSAFTNHFILDIQKDVINSQFYLFDEIRVNEYLYIVVDTKKDGITGVFTTMLINAIIKQAITHLKYEKEEEVRKALLELKERLSEFVTEENVRRAKQFFRGNFELDHETRMKKAWYSGVWEILGRGTSFDKEILDLVENIPVSRLKEVAERVASEPYHMVVIKDG